MTAPIPGTSLELVWTGKEIFDDVVSEQSSKFDDEGSCNVDE